MEVLKNIYDNNRVDDDKLLLYSLILESFLLQATAFYDFYMLYICSFFQIEQTNYFSERKFFSALENIQNPLFDLKAKQVKEYFEKESPQQRRVLLKKLRHSTIHRDNIRPSFEANQSLLGMLLGERSVQLYDDSCSQYCQNIQNDMFTLVVELSPVLFELEWKPGPFRANLWD